MLHRKRVHRLASIGLALGALGAGCSREPEPVSMTLELDGKPIATCNRAEVRALGGGGWRFSCPGNDVYVMYDSTDAKDGTIKSLDVTVGTANQTAWLAAVYVTRKPELAGGCPSAVALARKSGEPPLPTAGNGPAHGAHAIALARPCGMATLRLGPPR